MHNNDKGRRRKSFQVFKAIKSTALRNIGPSKQWKSGLENIFELYISFYFDLIRFNMLTISPEILATMDTWIEK